VRLADVVPAVGGPDGEQVHARHLRIVALRPVELSGLLGVGDDASRGGPRDALLRSAAPRAVVVGAMTAPIFMSASIESHSSTWLSSMTSTGSPLPIPRSTNHAASLSDLVAMSSKE